MAALARRLIIGLAMWLMAGGLAIAASPVDVIPGPEEPPQRVLVLFQLPPPHFSAGSSYSDSYGNALGRSARRRIAIRLAREQGLKLEEDWAMPLIGVDCYVMSVPAGRSVNEVARQLSLDKRVAWAEPMNTYRAQARRPVPNDPLFAAQPSAVPWRLADLHAIATGRSVKVAVIDSAVDRAHPDLAGRVLTSRDFAPSPTETPERHGTAVAGVIAAQADNAQGIVGVAPDARLLALRACWQSANSQATICDSLSIAKALDFAIRHDAQVINLSLSGPPAILLGRLIDVALDRGVIVVSAIDDALPRGGFPASHRGVVAVTDVAPARSGAYFAPGRDVITTLPDGRWSTVAGSSYSAAHVSGLFALLRERSTKPLGPMSLMAARTDVGAIDTCATLLVTFGPCDCACAHIPPKLATSRE